MEHVSLDVCTDCLLHIAYGQCEGCMVCAFSDTPDNEPCQTVGDRIWEFWTGWELAVGTTECGDCATGSGECEPWFSRQSCDGCGRWLPGDRHHATAFRR